MMCGGRSVGGSLLLLLCALVGGVEVPSSLQDQIGFRFTTSTYDLSVPENSVGKTYASSAPGAGRIGIHLGSQQLTDIRFKIVAGDKDKFFKAEDRLVGDFCFLFIRTRTGNNDVLNRERKDKYFLEVRAIGVYRDGKQRVVLEANANVVMTILDTNDLSPLFYPTEYNATLFEDTAVHQSILRVLAEDADLGRNGEIYYSFAEETEQFAVHPISGVLSLSKPLRYAEASYHELTVIGQDRGVMYRSGGSMLSKAKVRIRVKKVNLYSPEIRVKNHPQIVENSNADIYAIVHVTDRDSGIHGEILSLQIVDGDPDGHFRIRQTETKGEYNIEVQKLLDREQTPQGYSLHLRAIDCGVPPRESYKTVQVHLADLNDNAPVFNKEIYDVKVPETAPINTPLIRLKVTDADQGRNAQVFLEIVGGNEGGEFYVNPDSGMLYTAVSLDAELKSIYSLTVSAIDQGNAGTRKQSSAKVKIYVEDTNDNDPVFDKSEMVVWLDENMPSGSSVATVHATDKDRGENAYISYLIVNLNLDKVPFDVDHFSGVVRTTALLDYERMRREYVLRIRASDWGLPYRRQTEMELTVRVRGVNDNRPQFEKVDCRGNVPRSLPIGTELMTLSAIDFDAGNTISYSIIAGNEDGCFNMDITSGAISVTCDLSDVRVAQRDLNVTATDGTHFADVARISFKLVNAKRRPQLDAGLQFECKDTGVTRRLTEVLAAAENNNRPPDQEEFAMMPTRYGQNMHAPEFIDFPVQIKVNESVALGTTLVKLGARDRDLGYNGELVFGISGGDEHSVFCLDVDTGELRVIGYLDRERVGEYLLNVTVYDLGKPQKSASRVLPVAILDVNDNAPKFSKSLASFRVAENALNGTVIFRAQAKDADAGDNARITFALVTDTRDFVVDRFSGVLAVAGQLDRERQETYELRIRATDAGGKDADNPPLFSDALVRVLIDDVNDNAPTFSLPTYVVKIREDVPKGSVVAVISASDPDLGPEGEVVYRLEDGDAEGAFKIDRVSGSIRSTKALDFEEVQVHNLIVVASDGGNPSMSAETSVTINVVDVNENVYTPHFTDFVYAGSVSENLPLGSVVMQVNATDQDAPGEDSKIEYSIRGGDGIGIFGIDNNGVIRTQAVLDYETKTHYWLTVYAQDHGVVPLYSSVEVYIRVINENDNVPLSEKAVYHATVAEDSPEGTVVTQLYATDMDMDAHQNITFTIVSGNPEGFFTINTYTGLITTTIRRLDRETQEEYILEILISDNGTPSLHSTTRVVVTVTDLNDNAPEFEQTFYKVQVPVITSHGDLTFNEMALKEHGEFDVQNDMPMSGDFDGADAADDGAWELSTTSDVEGLELIARVLAFDKDNGMNGNIEYSLRSGRGVTKFKIHKSTGAVFAHPGLRATEEYELQIRATDGGNKSSTCRMIVNVISITQPSKSAQHPPELKTATQQHVQVTENDNIGFLVCLIQAIDADNDTLWYDIVDGDVDSEFYIGRENGNLLLAKRLDFERRSSYILNISVTDGHHVIFTTVQVTVIDINDNSPEFSNSLYKIDISEAVASGTEVVRLEATDADRGGKLVYALHAARSPLSQQLFRVDSMSGVVTLMRPLDRELLAEHVLTVMVRDGGTPAKRNYARVQVNVHDHNDHAPHFCEQILLGKVHETAAVGSAVLRAFTVDHDKGENARVTYAIASGNVGNVFEIDEHLGIVGVARELDLATASEYTLYIKAMDHGKPPLFASVPAHITLTMADNAPPRFADDAITAEIYENKHVGSYVAHLNVRSTSSLQFEIIDGNVEDTFAISPSTGVLVTQKVLDFERVKLYNLTVMAVNMASASSTCNIIVHILDKNDNAPQFQQATYLGIVPETAAINSLILSNESAPLVIKASDADSDVNSLLFYDIVESLPRQYFHIDSSTGAIRTTRLLDFEAISKFEFHVQVTDRGKPRLSAEVSARVEIRITDVNDCPPVFSAPIYNATLLLPTYKHVAVVQLNASDPDSAENTHLRFDILDGNKLNLFAIDGRTGLIRVLVPDALKSRYMLQVRVSDGVHSSIAKVYVRVEQSENSGLTFHKAVYTGSVMENTTKTATVCVVNVLGSALNEHLEFRILNPSALFSIGRTSGVIQTTGVRFDREKQEFYHLIVEARSGSGSREKPRVAHVIVNVTVMDENDNCPMFVNLPYYAVVSIDDKRGSVITKVHAIDMDSDENGEVRYELIKGSGELFKVQRDSGDVELKQNLEGHNREYELLIAAYDKGMTPCRSDVTVYVKVIDRSMPVFKKQFYSDTIPENTELHTSLPLAVQAESPLGRKLIYSIVKGNELEEFELDFNTAPNSNNGPCVLFIADELDYEEKQHYELIVRATDAVSGVYAEVPVSIQLQDVNDNPPEFSQESYNVSVSEAAAFGTPILTVHAIDKDTGVNKKLIYSIRPDAHNNTDLFYVDEDDGTIFLKQSLDHESARSHHFIVEATDEGLPRLSTTTHVWVQVLDMNDNPPKFEQPSYFCAISVYAKRDQFVTIVSASDPDSVDQTRLHYTIIAGNEHQTFSMSPHTGIITLVNLANFGGHKYVLLNVSVSDGVYTNFARVKVELLPANLHSPVFPDVVMNVELMENQPANTLVAEVRALDEDFGDFGVISYSIHSDLLNASFAIEARSGRITSRVPLDRETQKVYEIPVMAADGGGRCGFLIVRVSIADENDNAPKFSLREYKSSIPTNFNIGTPFLHIKAIDLDESDAGLTYSIYEEKSSGITDVFAIDATSGGISLVKHAAKFEGEVFQFFVRATDTVSPTLHSDVPVNVLIMSASDRPPIFERKDEKFFFSENSATGTIITRLKMVSNVSVAFQIISGAEDEPQFTVDSNGIVSLARPLNFETQMSHLIGILAETDSSPPLTALNEITVQVLDENDHAPEFESKPYSLYLAENVAEGTSILKVIAHDRDHGNNGELRYSFGSTSGDAVNVFALDSFTGWITTLIKLDKETKGEYKFAVIATDNGSPKYTAHTSVHIKLKDYNDSPPQFKKKLYQGAINEDALPGTVVISLEVTDADEDLSTPVQYYIVAGDATSNFQVRETGELYVVKPLDRETVAEYHLNVIVTDGLFSDFAQIHIQVLDVNDNPPYCLVYRYRQVLSEALSPGAFVLNVKANDIDDHDHSKLRYFLTGNGSAYFSLDKDTGYLKTITHIDREKQNKFLLTAHVQDREHLDWECTSQIELLVSDVNDNEPKFSSPEYSVSLAENVEIGTLITKIHATDADVGINRKIKYFFTDTYDDFFKLEPDSGIITLMKPLDREQKAAYNLSIRAVDQGTPQLSSLALLNIIVQDINDNPPEFASKQYFAIVPEIDAIATEVARVLATSKDTGVNADIYYTIIGGNEHRKFGIDKESGVIVIAEALDFERAHDYFLTIQATDGGTPPLSNIATVNISVTDCNDNAPIFGQSVYHVHVREDALVGDKIMQVTATDLDSDANGRIEYSIINGDKQQHFAVDLTTGYISINKPLDRETISSYVLEVLAKDNGLPVLSRQVNVNVEISDTNDNPPMFSNSNYSTIIQEDKPIGYPIIKFIITDNDIEPNTKPYTYDFLSGNEANHFRLEQDGILRTATKFNHKVKENFLLQIRVFDNGSPPLYSDATVLVKVIEESQYPPILTPLEININSFLDEFAGGHIGKVFANDQDKYDSLSYSLVPTMGNNYPTHEYFKIDRSNGTLRALPRLDIGEYRLNVSVTDGKYSAHTVVKINVEIVTEDMLENAIVIRFREVSPDTFVLSHRKGFLRAIRTAMKSKIKDVVIISVQPYYDELAKLREKRYIIEKDLDVLFTVRKPENGYYTVDALRKTINGHLEELEDSTKLVVEEIVQPKCTSNYCLHGICHDRYTLDTDRIKPISTEITSFVSASYKQRLECTCKEGYGGDKCDLIINECARSPCPSYKICIPDASIQQFSCQCPQGYAGTTCDVDISNCHDETCYIARNPISFSGKSYAQYGVINKKSFETQLNLSMRIRTVQPTGSLMYAAGRVDYNILELVNGALQYRFELGSGEGVVRVSASNIHVSDGKWHEVRLEREKNTARLTIDGYFVAQGSAPGISDVLNLQGDQIYLGAEVYQHPTILGLEDVQRGFIGCMDDVRIAKVSVPLHVNGDNSIAVLKRFSNVEFNCDSAVVLTPQGACGSQPCLNGGTCSDKPKGGYECVCHERYKGALCDMDTKPCASSPCLFGGKCIPSVGDFTCECLYTMSGKRCEYGRYCYPNPCKNGGVCEEGDEGALCKCRSFTGEFCEFDLDECQSGPCHNGGQCVNEIGSFRCICPANTTGSQCTTMMASITPFSFPLHITIEQFYIICAACVILVLFIITCTCVTCWWCRRRRRFDALDEHKTLSTNNHESEVKRGSKISNLEMDHHYRDAQNTRPLSFTPSSIEPYANCTSVYNNLDTLRSYGSAGDELENIPPDYYKNINRNQPEAVGNYCDSDKIAWASQMHLGHNALFNKAKFKNDMKVENLESSYRNYGGKPAAKSLKREKSGHRPEDARHVANWASQPPLPKITEVNGSEVHDSSSFQSNESNESRGHFQPHAATAESFYQGDVESDFHHDSDAVATSLNGLNSESEDSRIPKETGINYPEHRYNIYDQMNGMKRREEFDDVHTYEFPAHRNCLRTDDDDDDDDEDDDIKSIITSLDERHSIIDRFRSSNDDLSNLCDIEDSENETEDKPLNSIKTIQQTSV